MTHTSLEFGVPQELTADASSASLAPADSSAAHPAATGIPADAAAPAAPAAADTPTDAAAAAQPETPARRSRPRKKAVTAHAGEEQPAAQDDTPLAEESPTPKRAPRKPSRSRTAKKTTAAPTVPDTAAFTDGMTTEQTAQDAAAVAATPELSPADEAAPTAAGAETMADVAPVAEAQPVADVTPVTDTAPATEVTPTVTEAPSVAAEASAAEAETMAAVTPVAETAPAAPELSPVTDTAPATEVTPTATGASAAGEGTAESADTMPATPRTYEEWIFANAALRAAQALAAEEAEAAPAAVPADAAALVTEQPADADTTALAAEPAAEDETQPARRRPRSRRKKPAQAMPETAATGAPAADVQDADASVTAEQSAAAAPDETMVPAEDAAGREAAPALHGMTAEQDGDQTDKADAANADDADFETADEADAVPDDDASASAEPFADDDAEDAAEDNAPLRKNRRGRRGGRSRKHRSKSDVETAVQLAEVPLKPTADEDADAEEPDDDDLDDAEEVKAVRPVNCRRRMFISVLPSEQVEVAIVEDGIVQEYYLEMRHQVKMKGNIYKGVIHNIDTNLQAAFVNYGGNKNGFLQIDEIHPEYFLTHHEPVKGKKYPPIQKVLRAGQEVLVQVVKEPNGSKGAFLTTWLSLAGRFLVLTPGQEQIGISRKVESDEERSRLREMMTGIEPGEGLGVIVRTVSAGTSKTTLKNDLQYLKRVWKDIRKRGTADAAPCLIYQEPGLAERAVRDYLTEDVSEIWVDNAEIADAIRETANLLFPRKTDLVKVHADNRQGMWERFNLQRQLEQIYAREVTLPSGGRLVFDQTEALLAIDINSGKISGKTNFEAMAHRTNMEAAEAIARQLKLRDIGGQVVIDFIEMRDKNHVRDVEKTLRVAMKNDRARHDVSRMSSFGLLELVRQRTGSSALSITMEPCPHCGGTGLRRNMEWQALQALRDIRRVLAAARDERCVYTASAELGMYLLNNKRQTLQQMEQTSGKSIEITIRP